MIQHYLVDRNSCFSFTTKSLYNSVNSDSNVQRTITTKQKCLKLNSNFIKGFKLNYFEFYVLNIVVLCLKCKFLIYSMKFMLFSADKLCSFHRPF